MENITNGAYSCDAWAHEEEEAGIVITHDSSREKKEALTKSTIDNLKALKFLEKGEYEETLKEIFSKAGVSLYTTAGVSVSGDVDYCEMYVGKLYFSRKDADTAKEDDESVVGLSWQYEANIFS